MRIQFQMKITISKGIKVALACMGLLIGSGLLQAQHLYTLEECIAIARKNSIALRISESSIRSTRSAQEELKMTAMPQLKFGAGTMYAQRANISVMIRRLVTAGR